jgi:hypothetical protein
MALPYHADEADGPRIGAEITFLRTDEGGKKIPPQFPGYWFLHVVVVQDRNFRTRPGEVYHAVIILDAPSNFKLGDTGRFILVILVPMHYPDDPCDELQPGVAFIAQEGSRVTAHGVVLDRAEPATGQNKGTKTN